MSSCEQGLAHRRDTRRPSGESSHAFFRLLPLRCKRAHCLEDDGKGGAARDGDCTRRQEMFNNNLGDGILAGFPFYPCSGRTGQGDPRWR